MEKFKRKIIPIEHLTYEYIGVCSKRKELEDIVRCLRNGDEGYFPDLTNYAEKKLRDVAPSSSLLRESIPLTDKKGISADYLREIESSLNEWEAEIKCADAALQKSGSIAQSKLPPVRSASTIGTEILKSSPSGSVCPDYRIKRDDYKSWDKFDVDDALMKMDVEEERLAEEAKKVRLQNEKKQKDITNLSKNASVTPGEFSPEEAKILSEKAREKGNEYFKEGDWSRAYACYSESYQLSPNCPACNNRAMTLIKLGNFEDAVKDCNYVLQREPNNVKALLRRSSALKCLHNQEHWRNALEDLETVISLEPNNKTAQNDYRALRKQLNLPDNNSKVRIEIEEVPRERLPLTYYGPSTSSFRCERNSLTHHMLAGPRLMCGDGVPCRCNRGAMKQNPICRNCGEKDLRELSERYKRARRPVPKSMCATYVVQEQMRKKKLTERSNRVASSISCTSRQFSEMSITKKPLAIREIYGDTSIDDVKKVQVVDEKMRSSATNNECSEAWDNKAIEELLKLKVSDQIQGKFVVDNKSQNGQQALKATDKIQGSLAAENDQSRNRQLVEQIHGNTTAEFESRMRMPALKTVDQVQGSCTAEIESRNRTPVLRSVDQVQGSSTAEIESRNRTPALRSVDQVQGSSTAEIESRNRTPALRSVDQVQGSSTAEIESRNRTPALRSVDQVQGSSTVEIESRNRTPALRSVDQVQGSSTAEIESRNRTPALRSVDQVQGSSTAEIESRNRTPALRSVDQVQGSSTAVVESRNRTPALKSIDQVQRRLAAENNETRNQQSELKVVDRVRVTSAADNEEARNRQLASKALERGQASFAADNMKMALAYYSTSLNLFANPEVFLLRAGVFEKLKKYDDAIADYGKVLENDPRNLKALVGRIVVSFKVVPLNQKLVTEYVEKAYALRPEIGEIRMFHQLVMNKSLFRNGNDKMVSKLEAAAAKEVDNQNGTTISSQTSHGPATPSAAGINGHVLHDTASCCAHHSPEERKRERNQRNKRKRKRGAGNEKPSQVKSKSSDLTNGVKVVTPQKPLGYNEKEARQMQFEFYDFWERVKHIDPGYRERIQLLLRIPPKHLVTIVGEMLDADLLSDFLHCLELMLKHENKNVAEYMSVLPSLHRFQAIRRLLDDSDLQRIQRINITLGLERINKSLGNA